MKATFLRVLRDDDKATALRALVADANTAKPNFFVFRLDPQAFRQMPGIPFAYTVSHSVIAAYKTHTAVSESGVVTSMGISTKDDFRFLRLWVEVSPRRMGDSVSNTFIGKYWVTLAKGGPAVRYFTDWLLVVNWEDGGRLLKTLVAEYRGKRGWGAHWTAELKGQEHWFNNGLSWSRRANDIGFKVLQSGSMFSEKGPGLFVTSDGTTGLQALLAVTNCSCFSYLVKSRLARVDLAQSYEAGLVQETPLPNFESSSSCELVNLSLHNVDVQRRKSTPNELSRLFLLPTLLQVNGDDLQTRADGWAQRMAEAQAQFDANQREIDRIALELYGLTEHDILTPEERADRAAAQAAMPSAALDQNTHEPESEADAEPSESADDGDEAEEPDEAGPVDLAGHADALISHLFGCAFGRWDIRFATGAKPTLELPDPFAPLPACSPGMLIGDDGLPLKEPPTGYPLRIDEDGILTDDADHLDDIVRRAREAMDVIFGERAGAWETDVCQALGVADLRDYFRKGGFWQAHVKRYSRSRRKAPIYWLLQSPKKHYALWLYLHRLTPDTLYKALVKYGQPKLRRETDALARMQTRRASAASPREARALDREMDKQQAVVTDVQEFCERLARAANLNLTPDLNDGVVLTIAPLHELVPWKEPRTYWDELRAGKYEWSSIGQQMRAKGLLK